MKKALLTSITILLLISSCTVSPEPIQYNFDECAYCKMKISDARFGAEMVTTKGKIFKYDSAECLIRTKIENEANTYAHILVTDYTNPNHLIDAQLATFLISEKRPSPMGGNLSSYELFPHAKKAQAENGGKLLDFEELLNEYKRKFQ